MLTLNQEEYEALVEFARRGTFDDHGHVNESKARRLEAFLKDLEKRNGITRHAVWLQWQELQEPLPPGTDFPEKWPPDKRAYISLVSRPISRHDIDRYLQVNAKLPVDVLITRDPAAKVGWTALDSFFK